MPKLMLFIFFLVVFTTNLPNASEKELEDYTQEQKAKNLFNIVRCPVCDGQSIKESDLEISKILRQKIRQLLKDNKSEDEIIAFLKDNYGSHIIFDPEKQNNTLLLRYLPLIAFVMSLFLFQKKITCKQKKS